MQSVDDDAFVLDRLARFATVLGQSDGTEHLLLHDGLRQVQLHIATGSVLNGPVCLRTCFSGFRHTEARLLTLQRLCQLWRLNRFPHRLFPREQRAPRWVTMLRAHDAARLGAGQREIAIALYGEHRIRADWAGGSDYLRLRVQRLLRGAERLIGGGYRALLQ